MTEVPLEVTPNALGSWCTMMMTPMPARNPVTMGSDRKSAIQPRRRSPTPNTTSPVTTAVTATSSKYRVVEGGASRRRTTAKSGAMVESAPTDMMGFEPTTTKTIVAVMNAIIATNAGTPASRDVASCSGTAIASKVTPARNCPETFARVTPLNVSRSPLPASRRPIGIRSLVLVDCEGAITSTYDGVARRLVGRDDLESLGELALLHAGTLRSHSRPRPQHLLQTLAVTNLTDVLAQCGVLLVEGLRDVDDHGRIDAAQPDLVDGVGLEPFANQFGKGVRVSRVGIHRAQRRLTGRHVVGVTREDAFVVALGTLGDDEVRSMRSDDARDLAAKGHRRLDATVGPVQEREVRDTDLVRRFGLFGFTDGDAVLARIRGVVAPGVTRRDETVRHVNAPVRQVRDCTGGAEIHVVGVRHHDERALD